MTKSERKKVLKESLNPLSIFENTSIFHDPIGSKKLDPYTVDVIKKNYRIWFDSWIKPELEELL